MIQQLIKLSVLFLIIIDPVGNLPMFISVLKPFSKQQQQWIIIREMCISLVLLLVVFFFGTTFFQALSVSIPTLKIAGGVMLLIIGIQMIFAKHSKIESQPRCDPFIVPLTIPAISGPAILATICFYSGHPGYNQLIVFLSIIIAWTISFPILLTSNFWQRLLKDNGLVAIERLFGFIVCMISTEMILQGLLGAL